MKNSSASSAATPTGRVYWRSLDELAATPEFSQFLEREFPEGATELSDPVSRRHFVKIMSASFMLAGIGLAGSGCRKPEEKIMPFGKEPENYIHGVPQFYATAMPARGGAIPLVAKSNDGRPTKLEGNSKYPGGNGGTDRYAQAAILNLYDPDRATRFTRDGQTVQPEVAIEALGELARQFAANRGAGVAFLGERTHSPSRRRLHQQVAEKLPQAVWYLHDGIDANIHERAASQAFGRPVRPVFRFDKATTILSLDCDFIGNEEDAHNNIRRFAAGRKIAKPGDKMSRLYAVESLFTLTGLNADHRLRVPASAGAQVASAIAAELGVNAGGLAAPAGLDAKWIAECAKDLKAHAGTSLVVAGYRQPLAVHLLAHAINAALGNVGKTVELLEAPEPLAGNLAHLVEALNAGRVDTLVIFGANPAHTAPGDLNWAAAQAKAKQIVRLGYYEDETAATAQWHFPLAHFLESWGDATTGDGTLVPIQPLIAPLFGGLTELEFLARLGGLSVTNPNAIVRETFTALTGQTSEDAWKKFLHDGFAPGTAAKVVTASFNDQALSIALTNFQPASPTKDNLEVVLYRDAKLDDGRYANNGWMQELPDPITKMVWDNAVLVSRKTARELGVVNGDVVEVTVGGRSVQGAIWTQPGMADFSLGIALGYGRSKVGRVGSNVGFNAYPLLSQTGYVVNGATVKKTGRTHVLACTQNHWSMEGRAIVREANLDQFEQHPDFVRLLDMPEAPDQSPMYPNPLDDPRFRSSMHQWGMSIDLNSCVGCNTCVLACQSENNIPIVGKDLVRRGREMHWLRLDRYYTSDPRKRPSRLDVYSADDKKQFDEWIDDVEAVNQPMLCQHCEAAPCESVCPVNATVHDHEGLNVMAYNRCVGTRYCSNNCPYKVRRYNYLDYNKRPLDKLKGPFYPSPITHSTGGKWDLLRWWKDPESGMRDEDEWDLIKMIKNPDVTVRMRGVMEKCTFCIQRIEQAKIAQKVKAGASGDVIVPDGTFTTACAQACPADAIVFGNIADPNSRVSKLKAQARDYSVLEFLSTKPRTTYLARVRNPNPALYDQPDQPDSEENWPYSLREFNRTSDKAFEHGLHHSHGTATGAQKGAH